MDPKDLQSMEFHPGGMWLPESAATSTPSVDDPFWIIYWTCVIAFVLVVAPMFYFMWKYRRKHEGQKALSQKDHSQTLEILWSAIPTVFFVWIFVLGFKGFMNLYVAPGDAMEIRVTGQKWQWTAKYPNGVTITGVGAEFPVPKDRPTKVVLTSVDVLHSFFIPNFRIKMDAVPWRYTTLWFEPTQEGTFPIFCTEYCGKDHSNMLARVKVMEGDAFDTWLKAEGEKAGGAPDVAKGEQVYNQVCVACHSLDGSRRVGPSFKGLAGSERQFADGTTAIADDNYLLESMLEPNKKIAKDYPPAMPSMKGTLNQTQLDSVILWLKTIK